MIIYTTSWSSCVCTIWKMTHYTAKERVKFEACNSLDYLEASKCSSSAWGVAIFFPFFFSLLVNYPPLTTLTLVHTSSQNKPDQQQHLHSPLPVLFILGLLVMFFNDFRFFQKQFLLKAVANIQFTSLVQYHTPLLEHLLKVWTEWFSSPSNIS